jgi:hypothetical protein
MYSRRTGVLMGLMGLATLAISSTSYAECDCASLTYKQADVLAYQYDEMCSGGDFGTLDDNNNVSIEYSCPGGGSATIVYSSNGASICGCSS